MKPSEVFLHNLYQIIEQQNLSIGEIENNLNLSKGYFSRHKAKGLNISLDVCIGVCEIINYPIEDMIDENFYLRQFIGILSDEEKKTLSCLIDETLKGKEVK